MHNSISRIAYYIAQKGNPENAIKFISKMKDFAYSLAIFPEKYPICRHISYAKRKYRCAVLKKYYIFIYKVIKNELVIFNIIHGTRLK
ncbi:MAG: type II toxin-antitoxin system RelE/ParE family toxin [Bacteroidetes bacterium]|nr:type II toxin-antitoxin system RelE/ParE family toxin [Bacteroidota bacterium]